MHHVIACHSYRSAMDTLMAMYDVSRALPLTPSQMSSLFIFFLLFNSTSGPGTLGLGSGQASNYCLVQVAAQLVGLRHTAILAPRTSPSLTLIGQAFKAARGNTHATGHPPDRREVSLRTNGCSLTLQELVPCGWTWAVNHLASVDMPQP